MDKRRAHKIQLKKHEDFSDAEEKRKGRSGQPSLPHTPLSTSGGDSKKPSSLISCSSASSTPGPGDGMAKKRKKKGKASGCGLWVWLMGVVNCWPNIQLL